MIRSRFAFSLFLFFLLTSCNKPEKLAEEDTQAQPVEEERAADSIVQPQDTLSEKQKPENKAFAAVPDTGFVVMNAYASGFAYDLKYATADNFLEKKVYECEQCLLRKEVADALREANAYLESRGLRIKFYDCYRPLDVQKQMWALYPKPGYVANPYKGGSIHNRGGAVDITLEDKEGRELEMGTAFDHFGKEAHHTYSMLPDTVLANRRLLKETLEAHGFSAIRTEWWHYNFKAAKEYPLSNFKVKCD